MQTFPKRKPTTNWRSRRRLYNNQSLSLPGACTPRSSTTSSTQCIRIPVPSLSIPWYPGGSNPLDRTEKNAAGQKAIFTLQTTTPFRGSAPDRRRRWVTHRMPMALRCRQRRFPPDRVHPEQSQEATPTHPRLPAQPASAIHGTVRPTSDLITFMSLTLLPRCPTLCPPTSSRFGPRGTPWGSRPRN